MHHNTQTPVTQTSYRERAILLSLILAVIGIISILLLFLQNGNHGTVADIYQNGSLIQSIPLDSVKETYTFTVTGEHGAANEIEVRPGSIGIISASCPDKLCVHQGFISGSLLPITCLPNRLVIQIRTEQGTINNYEISGEKASDNTQNSYTSDEITPDIITY